MASRRLALRTPPSPTPPSPRAPHQSLLDDTKRVCSALYSVHHSRGIQALAERTLQLAEPSTLAAYSVPDDVSTGLLSAANGFRRLASSLARGLDTLERIITRLSSSPSSPAGYSNCLPSFAGASKLASILGTLASIVANKRTTFPAYLASLPSPPPSSLDEFLATLLSALATCRHTSFPLRLENILVVGSRVTLSSMEELVAYLSSSTACVSSPLYSYPLTLPSLTPRGGTLLISSPLEYLEVAPSYDALAGEISFTRSKLSSQHALAVDLSSSLSCLAASAPASSSLSAINEFVEPDESSSALAKPSLVPTAHQHPTHHQTRGVDGGRSNPGPSAKRKLYTPHKL